MNPVVGDLLLAMGEERTQPIRNYIAKIETDRSLLYAAVKYALDRAQTDEDLGYLVGPGCEVFHRLCLGEAAYLGEPLEAVEERRGAETLDASSART